MILLLGAHLGPGSAWAADNDGDGFQPPEDCNDASAAQAPGLPELCDGLDNNCDGLVDEATVCATVCVNLARTGTDVIYNSDPAVSKQSALIWTGAGYGLAWTDERDGREEIYFNILDSSGLTTTGDLRVTDEFVPSSSRRPDLVWTGSVFAVAWVDERDGNNEIYFQAINATGTLIEPPLRVTNGTAFSGEPDLVWTGTEFAVAWTEESTGNREITFARITATGTLASGPTALSNDAAVSEQPSLVWTGDGYGVAWTDERDLNREIYFMTLDGTGTPTSPATRVTQDGAVSAQPSLAWNGQEYGVAWTDQRDGNREIYAQLISAAGIPLGTANRFTLDAAISDQPVLLWTGGEYGVVWRDTRVINGEIYFGRIGANGLRQSDDFRVSMDLGLTSRAPAAAWNGGGFAVTWDDIEINLARLDCGCLMGDADGDGVTPACNDCDDSDPDVYPGAPQLCDGKNNDCSDPDWPDLIAAPENDNDGDGFRTCDGDCDDTSAQIHPGVLEICNGLDDDCDSLVDEDSLGEDVDGDGVHGLCDVCPQTADPAQADTDGDQHGDLCDNCPTESNSGQADSDSDGEGDACDVDDDIIFINMTPAGAVDWPAETGMESYNAYRGDLSLLRVGGDITQDPVGSALAEQACALGTTEWLDAVVLAPGEIVHYLTTGFRQGLEGSLGVNSQRVERLHAFPCP